MASKYDAFWRERLSEIACLIDAAAHAHGQKSSLDVSRIQQLGERESWYGKATVRGQHVVEAPMAHLMALGNQVVADGLCSRYPDVTFTFTVDSHCRLLVAATEGREGRVGPSAHEATPPTPAELVVPVVATPEPSRLGTRDEVNATEACGAIHALVEFLPPYATPKDVPFRDGLYFFYEQGEASTHAIAGRIVRIGNHPRSDERLVARLREHYAGSKNASVFRLLLGGALIRRDDPSSACLAPGPGQGHWERHMEAACARCAPYEQRVSALLGDRFRIRCVRIENREERNRLESRLIATVAACTVCGPSTNWLGRFASSEKVKASGLWNSEFVGGTTMGGADLKRFGELVGTIPDLQAAAPAHPTPMVADLSTVLLLIPCSGGKQGYPIPPLPTQRIADLLGPQAARTLAEGRLRAENCIDQGSELRQALAYYTGQPYGAPGFRHLLLDALQRGLHCLIVSAGYGLLRPEEPIHNYNAQMGRMLGIWRHRLPDVLRDYVLQNGIHRTFGAFSRAYAAGVPSDLTDEDWRAIAHFDPRSDSGAPLQVVPRKVGEALVALLRSDFHAPAPWLRC